MKRVMIAAMLACAVPAAAQMPMPVPAAAPRERGAMPLYPADGPARSEGENWMRFGALYAVRNVTRATITPFLPDPKKATGAAVLVAPGGAFMILAMEHEGWNVARWLADQGIAAFVLKYRLNPTPMDEGKSGQYMAQRMAEAMRDPNAPPVLHEPRATQDALAALRMIRKDAGKWGIDPKRVGMIGFSAGAMTTMNATLEGAEQDRPSFIGYIYGPMLARNVPADVPPLFTAIAVDDGMFGGQPYGIVDAWRKVKRPVEFHAYERGDHGFGMGKPGTTTMGLLPQFRDWMAMRGLLKAEGGQ